MNNRDNVVVSPFLNGAYPLTYDRSDEGDTDAASAIAEINSHIDKQKEFKYNKYDIDGLKKFVDALNDPRAKGKFVIICN